MELGWKTLPEKTPECMGSGPWLEMIDQDLDEWPLSALPAKDTWRENITKI